MLRYRKEKEEIVSRFLRLYDAGMINMFEGNISMRMDDCVLITPSQMRRIRSRPKMSLRSIWKEAD